MRGFDSQEKTCADVQLYLCLETGHTQLVVDCSGNAVLSIYQQISDIQWSILLVN